MTARVLCTLPLPDPFAAMVSARAQLDVVGSIVPSADLAERLRHGVDVLAPQLRDRVDAGVMDAALPRLRAVCNYAVGFDNIDVPAATERGIVVTNTPGVLTDATADCAVGLMLAAARRLCEGDREMREGRYAGWEPEYLLGLDLNGATLALVGFGRIGQAVARRALAFDMQVLYVEDGDVPVDPALAGRVRRVDFDTAVREADVISLHTPLTAQTRHLVGEDVLRRMKPTSVLVNTSRGPVVDEAALVRALREGWIAAAGLDVYEREPEMSPGLAECRNAVLAPHLGSATVKTRAAMARLCAENVLAALDGELPPTCLNPDAWAATKPAPAS
ncbi:MAG TPA: D-glycerate dehydrogenase [Candidatus Dormibacteraeota bacterium]|nr:D-glycerate dehydrogenase [Candidatus Dormibacteraeota bacterium]